MVLSQADTPILFQHYRVHIQQMDSGRGTLCIYNPGFTKKYSLELQEALLKKINIHTLRTAFIGKNPQISAQIQEKVDLLELTVRISIPLLPTITQTIECLLEKELQEEESNLLVLSEVAKKCYQTKEMFKKANTDWATQEVKVSQVGCAQESTYNDNNNGEYVDYVDYNQLENNMQEYGALNWGELELEPKTHYLLTLSFFAYKLLSFQFYYGNSNYSTAVQVLSSGYNTQHTHDTQSGYLSHVFRQKVMFQNAEQPIKFFTYDNEQGAQFRNILITAQKLDS